MLSSTVTVRRASDPNRWVRVTLSPRPVGPGDRFLTHAAGYVCRITPADPDAAGYTADNWESGLMSGLGYAWRRWFRPEGGAGLIVSELTGQLGHGDIEGVAAAALEAARELGGQPPAPPAGWVCDQPAFSSPVPAVALVTTAV